MLVYLWISPSIFTQVEIQIFPSRSSIGISFYLPLNHSRVSANTFNFITAPEGTPELIPSGISDVERKKFKTHWKYNCGKRDDLNIQPEGSAYRSNGQNEPDTNTTYPDQLQVCKFHIYKLKFNLKYCTGVLLYSHES